MSLACSQQQHTLLVPLMLMLLRMLVLHCGILGGS
jgi:hypothetical protein